jgi:hypothetical protein
MTSPRTVASTARPIEGERLTMAFILTALVAFAVACAMACAAITFRTEQSTVMSVYQSVMVAALWCGCLALSRAAVTVRRRWIVPARGLRLPAHQRANNTFGRSATTVLVSLGMAGCLALASMPGIASSPGLVAFAFAGAVVVVACTYGKGLWDQRPRPPI